MGERWVEVLVVCPPESAEAVAELLHELGSNGTVLEDTLDTDRVLSAAPGDMVVSGYFVARDYTNSIEQRLGEGLDNLAWRLSLNPKRFQLSQRDLSPQDWSESWKEFYHVTHVDERIVVVPEWEDYEPTGNQVVIRIDPGMAFGSGTHDSTRFALHAVHRAMDELGSPPQVLDVGTGSGILALATLKLGATAAVGVDIDPHACERARGNARLNGELDRLTLVPGDLANYVAGAQGEPVDWYTEEPGEGRANALQANDDVARFRTIVNRRFDLVCANLTPDLLLYLAIPLRHVTKRDGFLVLSGITGSRESRVLTGLEALGFVRHHRFSRPDSEWVAWLMRGVN